jgi:hypothetical protein
LEESLKGNIARDFDEQYIYSDKKLIAGVKQSMREARAGKGKILKSDKEMDEYFKAI